MLKLLVFSVLSCQGVFATSGEDDSTDMPSILKHSQAIAPNLRGLHNYYASRQIFHFDGKPSTDRQNTEMENQPAFSTSKIRSSYKIHPEGRNWNDARKKCIEDGGHLASFRTTEDLEALKSAMRSWAIDLLWVGYHDMFTEGEWLSVLNEPISSIKWGNPWSTEIPNNPDNHDGNEDCAAFIASHNGLNDDNCANRFSFACEFK